MSYSNPNQQSPDRYTAKDLGKDLVEGLVWALIEITYWVVIIAIFGFLGWLVAEGTGLLIGLLLGAGVAGLGYLILLMVGIREVARDWNKNRMRSR